MSDGLWVRVIDVPAALSLRRYSCPVNVVIEVTDDTCPWNQGRWRLATSGAAPWAGHCPPTRTPRTWSFPPRPWPPRPGGTRLGSLARAGLAAEVRPGALAALSAALSWTGPVVPGDLLNAAPPDDWPGADGADSRGGSPWRE